MKLAGTIIGTLMLIMAAVTAVELKKLHGQKPDEWATARMLVRTSVDTHVGYNVYHFAGTDSVLVTMYSDKFHHIRYMFNAADPYKIIWVRFYNDHNEILAEGSHYRGTYLLPGKF